MEEEQQMIYLGIILIVLAGIGLFFAGMILGFAAIGGSIGILTKTKETKTRVIAIIALICGIIITCLTFIAILGI